MRFLSSPESEELATRVGLDPHDIRDGARMRNMKSGAFFFYKSPMTDDHAHAVARHLIDLLGEFSFAMLWAYDLPFGDRLRDENPEGWRRYAQRRQAAGESRTLHDAPGHLFEPNDSIEIADAIAFAIEAGWDAVMIARPLRCLVTLSHDDLIAIQSRHNLTALSSKLTRLGLSRSDFREPLRRDRRLVHGAGRGLGFAPGSHQCESWPKHIVFAQ